MSLAVSQYTVATAQQQVLQRACTQHRRINKGAKHLLIHVHPTQETCVQKLTEHVPLPIMLMAAQRRASAGW